MAKRAAPSAPKRRSVRGSSPFSHPQIPVLSLDEIRRQFGKQKWVEFSESKPTKEQLAIATKLRRGDSNQCFGDSQLAVVESQTDRTAYVEGYLLVAAPEPNHYAVVHHGWVVIDGEVVADPTLTDLRPASIGKLPSVAQRLIGVVFPRKKVVGIVRKAFDNADDDGDFALECLLPQL